jgi:hypothetical protein
MRRATGVHLQAIGKLSPHYPSDLSMLPLGKTVPQRLKPIILGSSYGTAVEAAEKIRESPEGTAELSPCPGKTNVARAVP